MPIVTLEQMKEQLAFTADLGDIDNDLIERKIAAAQDHVERWLGYKIEATYGGAGQSPIPPSLVEAVCQLAAWWYENRETASEISFREVPFGVAEIVSSYRGWSF